MPGLAIASARHARFLAIRSIRMMCGSFPTRGSIYQAPSGASLISVGRPRRKPGDGPDRGSDCVIKDPARVDYRRLPPREGDVMEPVRTPRRDLPLGARRPR